MSRLLQPDDEITALKLNLKRLYTRSPLNDPVKQALDLVDRNLRNGSDRRIVAVIGAPGAGKTRTVCEQIRRHTVFAEAHRQLDAPSPCSVGALGSAILTKLGHPIARGNIREHELVTRIESILPFTGVHLIHIDEAHHALNTAGDIKLTATVDFWKRLTQCDYPLALVLSGIARVSDVMRMDQQLARRTIFVEAKPLRLEDISDVDSLASLYAEKAGLSYENDYELAERIIHSADYAYGQTCDLIIDAIERSLRAGDPALTAASFASAYAATTDVDHTLNPFLSDTWRQIDTQQRQALPSDPDLIPRHSRRRRGAK